VAGLGGCPYAKGATGNVATEDVVFMLQGMGIDTGIDLDALVDAGGFISGVLGRAPVSRAGKALLASARRSRHEPTDRARRGMDPPEGFRRVAQAWPTGATRMHRCGWTCPPAPAQEAAEALGVQVGQIAKSVIFRRRADDAWRCWWSPAGDRRVDEHRWRRRSGPRPCRCRLRQVRTGFSIGGVAPPWRIASCSADCGLLIDRDVVVAVPLSSRDLGRGRPPQRRVRVPRFDGPQWDEAASQPLGVVRTG
jgi:hypothetical protein